MIKINNYNLIKNEKPQKQTAKHKIPITFSQQHLSRLPSISDTLLDTKTHNVRNKNQQIITKRSKWMTFSAELISKFPCRWLTDGRFENAFGDAPLTMTITSGQTMRTVAQDRNEPFDYGDYGAIELFWHQNRFEIVQWPTTQSTMRPLPPRAICIPVAIPSHKVHTNARMPIHSNHNRQSRQQQKLNGKRKKLFDEPCS